jgi:hypothetical protein
MLDVKEKLNLLTQIYFFFNIKHQKYFFCQWNIKEKCFYTHPSLQKKYFAL